MAAPLVVAQVCCTWKEVCGYPWGGRRLHVKGAGGMPELAQVAHLLWEQPGEGKGTPDVVLQSCTSKGMGGCAVVVTATAFRSWRQTCLKWHWLHILSRCGLGRRSDP